MQSDGHPRLMIGSMEGLKKEYKEMHPFNVSKQLDLPEYLTITFIGKASLNWHLKTNYPSCLLHSSVLQAAAKY